MNPNTSLKPGQMFAVDPAAIHMLQPVRAEAPQESSETESSAATMDPAEVPGSEEASAPSKTPSVSAKQVLPFHLPDYAAPFLFIPPYLEVNFPTASAVYVRHPTAGPGYSEVPTPYEADGEVVRLAWEWYAVNGKRRMKRTAKPGNDYRRRGNSSSHTVDLGQQKPS